MGSCQAGCKDFFLSSHCEINNTDADTELSSLRQLKNSFQIKFESETSNSLVSTTNIQSICPEMFKSCALTDCAVESKEFTDKILLYPYYNTHQIVFIQNAFRKFLQRKTKIKCKQDTNSNFLVVINTFVQIDDNTYYRGTWRDRMREGLGIALVNEGYVYFGEFKRNKMNGIGIISNNVTNLSFQGYFQDDLICGFGHEMSNDGSEFIGEYLSNQKNGIGILTFNDGSYFEGEFSGNNINGYGCFYKNNGTILKGYFTNNKLNGIGICENLREYKSFEGEFADGEREGFGILREKEKKFIGTWRRSKLEGEVLIVKQSGVKRYMYQQGKKIRELHYESLQVGFDNIED